MKKKYKSRNGCCANEEQTFLIIFLRQNCVVVVFFFFFKFIFLPFVWFICFVIFGLFARVHAFCVAVCNFLRARGNTASCLAYYSIRTSNGLLTIFLSPYVVSAIAPYRTYIYLKILTVFRHKCV